MQHYLSLAFAGVFEAEWLSGKPFAWQSISRTIEDCMHDVVFSLSLMYFSEGLFMEVP